MILEKITKVSYDQLIPIRLEETNFKRRLRINHNSEIKNKTYEEMGNDICLHLKNYMSNKELFTSPMHDSIALSTSILILTPQERYEILKVIQNIKLVFNGIGIDSHLNEIISILKKKTEIPL